MSALLLSRIAFPPADIALWLLNPDDIGGTLDCQVHLHSPPLTCPADMQVDEAIRLELRISASAPTQGPQLSFVVEPASLAVGTPESGEALECVTFSSGAQIISIASRDQDWMCQALAHQRGKRHLPHTDADVCTLSYLPNGLHLALGPLSTGETISLPFGFARAEHPSNVLATWFGADAVLPTNPHDFSTP